MSQEHPQRRQVVRSAFLLAAAPVLVYCVALLYFESSLRELGLPWPGAWMALVALAGAVVAVATGFPGSRAGAPGALRILELLVRYALALLLIQYALNKIIPGQFLLYNRDLDLAVRDLPGRRVAWHFLGHSRLYNGFIAGCELAAGLLLLSGRTVLGGALLSLFTLLNIVVIDLAFGLRGALPIATVMAFAALAIVVHHLDPRLLQPLLWRRPEGRPTAGPSPPARLIRLAMAGLVVGVPLYANLATRRGLDGQVPAAGRWEVLACSPDPGWAMCGSGTGTGRPVLYLEVGQWGQLVTGPERRAVAFTYDRRRGALRLQVAAGAPGEPGVTLEGTVRGADTTAILAGTAGGRPVQVQLRRTRGAPWPPVRVF
jgi:hypothetical protein